MEHFVQTLECQKFSALACMSENLSDIFRVTTEVRVNVSPESRLQAHAVFVPIYGLKYSYSIVYEIDLGTILLAIPWSVVHLSFQVLRVCNSNQINSNFIFGLILKSMEYIII